MIITKQIRGDEFNLIKHISKCKTNKELLDVILKFIPSDALNEYNYQKEKINMTPQNCRFIIYDYLRNNQHSINFNRTIKKISENISAPKDIIKKSIDMLIESNYIIDYVYGECENKTIFYYDII